MPHLLIIAEIYFVLDFDLNFFKDLDVDLVALHIRPAYA